MNSMREKAVGKLYEDYERNIQRYFENIYLGLRSPWPSMVAFSPQLYSLPSAVMAN
jgi:hypothetical protein